jgi:DNA-binding CsgD family transcriptional regulator/PAS domain-containing protein
MSQADTIHHVIKQLYAASLAPAEWPRAMAALTSAIGAQRGLLLSSGTDSAQFAVSTGLEPRHAQRLAFEFENRLPDWIRAIPVGTAQRQSSAITDDEFRRSSIYNEAVRPAGAFYGIVAPLGRTSAPSAHFSAGKDLGAADFTDDDLRTITLIIPHLTMALEVRQQLAAADLREKAAAEALSQLNIGVILLDAGNRPVFVNARAQAIADGGDGLLLSAATISASSPDDSQCLQEAIQKTSAISRTYRDDGAMAGHLDVPIRCRLRRKPPRPPLVVNVVPVDGSIASDCLNLPARVLLLIVEPDCAPCIEPPHVDLSFQLTRREAQIAMLLASGINLHEAALQMGIGIGTARGYLKQVLAKTGTHRQAALVALVIRCGYGMRGAVT